MKQLLLLVLGFISIGCRAPAHVPRARVPFEEPIPIIADDGTRYLAIHDLGAPTIRFFRGSNVVRDDSIKALEP